MNRIVKNGMTSSKEITAVYNLSMKDEVGFVGKSHKNVIRDIRNMLESLGGEGFLHDSFLEVKDNRGYTSEIFLDEDLTACLISGWSVKARLAMIVKIRNQKKVLILHHLLRTSKENLGSVIHWMRKFFLMILS